jgi:enterochelin esterase-like enzyme
LPDILRAENLFTEGKALARFIADSVLPKVQAETPALPGPAHVAIDGVSLGGRAALALVAYEPKAFSVVAATQPALDEKELAVLVAQLAQARQQNPKLQLRLLTSDQDYFLDTTRMFSKGLTALHVEHQLDQVMGNHSYDFNRGPGVHEMLLFADRALRSGAGP